MAEREIKSRMNQLGIREADLQETFARSSGPGGQNVNKVSTSVTLRHSPSGISITVQDSRSQAMNRKLARERLLDAIESVRRERRAAEIAAREKVRRQKSLTSRGTQAENPGIKTQTRRAKETTREGSTLRRIRRANTSADATCDELVVNKHSRYEKRNDINCCLSRSGTDAGFLLERAADHHHYHASNHSHGAAATAAVSINNDDNTSDGWRLLSRLL